MPDAELRAAMLRFANQLITEYQRESFLYPSDPAAMEKKRIAERLKREILSCREGTHV